MKYVLVTAAKNEALNIRKTILSISQQTIKPEIWVIVSDSSIDETDEIVKQYAKENSFIKLIRKENSRKEDGFSSKVFAFLSGYDSLRDYKFDLIGNLDADITMESDYYERIIKEFIADPLLGIAGGMIYDVVSGKKRKRSPENESYVCGGIQMFRRACFEEIGGYVPLKEGGEDTVAVIKAQMAGWHVRVIKELDVLHHKISAKVRGGWGDNFREGAMFCMLGSYLLVEMAKSMMRMKEKPYILGGVARASGYLIAYVKRKRVNLGEEFVKYIRKEQRARIGRIFRNYLKY